MADNRFPLFRLPLLVLCIILNFYTPHDIIQLSLCSKRGLRVAKKCWKKKGVIKALLTAQVDKLVDVIFSNPACEYRFVISRAKFKYLQDEQVHRIRIGDAFVPSSHKDTETVIYWQDKIHGIEQVVSYIKDLFGVQIHTIDLNTEEYRNEFIRAMDCVMNLQGSVKECTLTGSYPIDDSLTHLLDNCQVTKELRIYGRPTRQFRNDWKIRSDHLHISYGSCLTYQDLTNINCKFLELHNSSLTSKDINQFFKHWQNVGNSVETLRMADNRFPLFRLPFMALCIIMNLFSPHDIIQLSLCSKRSIQAAKKCWKKKGVIKTYFWAETVPNIDIFFYDPAFEYRFVISEARDLQGQQVNNIKIGDAVVPSIYKDTETVTFWKDKIHGIEQIVRYIKDLFDVPIHSINLETEEQPNDFIRIMDSIMSVQESIEECTLNGEDPIDDCLTHLLDHCKITGSLSIHEQPSRQFSNDWNIHLDDLYISNGSSITFQNLTNIDCQSLELRHGSSLTSEDANQFLKHWQNGGNSRIKFLSIRINPLIQETITSGIDFVLQPQGLRRYYRGMNNFKILMSGGIDIRRNDGKIGSIFFNNNKFEFGVDSIED
ncbi:unnamed protein product [Caenorhabditis brenneri]